MKYKVMRANSQFSSEYVLGNTLLLNILR